MMFESEWKSNVSPADFPPNISGTGSSHLQKNNENGNDYIETAIESKGCYKENGSANDDTYPGRAKPGAEGGGRILMPAAGRGILSPMRPFRKYP
jgi:hypothetical protein